MDVGNFIDLISWSSRQYLQCKCHRDKSKQYDQFLWCHVYGVIWVNEWKRYVLYWNPQNCVTLAYRMPMQTSQQNQRRFGTTSTVSSTADWLLTWHTHEPDIKKVCFLYIDCSLVNFAQRTTAMFISKFQTNWKMAKKMWRNSAERLWHFSFG